MNLRNLQWFDAADPDSFFPRCYRLGAEDEKHAFVGQHPHSLLLTFLIPVSNHIYVCEVLKPQHLVCPIFFFFSEDFRRTACTSLLQFLVERSRGEWDDGEVVASAGTTNSARSSKRQTCFIVTVNLFVMQDLWVMFNEIYSKVTITESLSLHSI